MRRTAKELVDEMKDAEAYGFSSLLIIVKFKDRPRAISNEDPEAVGKLKELIQAGGEPIGLVGMRQISDKRFEIASQAFEEYEGKEWVLKYLDAGVEEVYRRAGGDAAKWVH
jgi:predicted deacetylase